MKEQIYNDFVTKLLPKIQEGLVITKDYFLDLFGRYIKYLIIIDSIQLTLSLVVVISSVVYLIKGIKIGIEEDWSDGAYIFLIFCAATFLFFSLISLSTNIEQLIKDIYIPEIRVYEELKYLNNK